MRNTQWIGVGLVVLGLMAGGCKSSDPDPSNYHQTRDAFDSVEDPPLTARTRVAAGMLAESQGDLNKAAGQYREALKLEANNHEALFHLGDVLTKQKQYADAITTWQQYLKATNNSPDGYCDLAICYEQAGQIPQSESTFRAGMAAHPTDTTCRVQYGLMLARQGRFEDATAQLAPVLKPAAISYQFGEVCRKQNKPDQAKAWYTKALQQDPEMAEPKAALAALK